jgi:hypothetical protein
MHACTNKITMENIASVFLRSGDSMLALAADTDVVVAAVNRTCLAVLAEKMHVVETLGLLFVYDSVSLRARRVFKVKDKGFWCRHGQIAFNPVDGTLLIVDGRNEIEMYDVVHGKSLGFVSLKFGFSAVSIVTTKTSASSCVAGLRSLDTGRHLFLTFHVGLGWTVVASVTSLSAALTTSMCAKLSSCNVRAVTPDGRVMFSYTSRPTSGFVQLPDGREEFMVSQNRLSLHCRTMSPLRVAWMTAVTRSSRDVHAHVR